MTTFQFVQLKAVSFSLNSKLVMLREINEQLNRISLVNQCLHFTLGTSEHISSITGQITSFTGI